MSRGSIPNESPFIGPRPFRRSESHLFFARDWETREVGSLIAASDVTVLFGVSGTGKTSLVNTAVIPLLEREGYVILPVCRPATGAIAVTGLDVNPFVKSALDAWQVGSTRAVTISEAAQALQKQSEPAIDERHHVAVFDQFEEIFSFPHFWLFRDQFIGQLAEAVSDVPTLHCVFVLREDHLASMEAAVGLRFGSLQARFRLDRLRRAAARQAIEGPLNALGKEITESAIDMLLDDLLRVTAESPSGEAVESVGEFVEPLAIQVVGDQLWRNLPAGAVSIDGAMLAKTQMRARRSRHTSIVDIALARFYEQAINEVADVAQVPALVLREWCESHLITASGTRAFVHRGRAATAGLSNDIPELLEARHLLASQWRAGAQWYELAHDRLVKPLITSNEERRRAREKTLARARRVVEEAELRMTLATEETVVRIEGRVDRTVRLFERLGDLDGAIDGLLALWVSQWRRQDDSGAYQTLRRALTVSRSLDAKRQLAILDILGNVAFKLDRYEDAVSHYTEIMEKTSQALWIQPLERRATAYWYLDQLDAAASDYQDCFSLAPESELQPMLLSCYGQVLAEKGEVDAAIPLLVRAIDQSRQANEHALVAYASSGLGLALAKTSAWSKSHEAFAESIRLEPENAWAYLNKGVALRLQGLTREALEALETALRLMNPALPPRKRARAARLIEECRGGESGSGDV